MLSPHWGHRSQDRPEGPRIKPLGSEEHVAYVKPLIVSLGTWTFTVWVQILSPLVFDHVFLGKLLNALGLSVVVCKMGQSQHTSASKDCSEHWMS